MDGGRLNTYSIHNAIVRAIYIANYIHFSEVLSLEIWLR